MSESNRSPRGRLQKSIVVGVLLFAVAMAGVVWFFLEYLPTPKPQNGMAPQGPQATLVDDLIRPIFLTAGVIGSAVAVTVLMIAIFYRSKSEDDKLAPTQTEGNNKLEISWTIAPAIVMLIVGLATVPVIFKLYDKPDGTELTSEVMGNVVETGTADDTYINIDVIGHQWWWEYRYEGYFADGREVVTANELVVPTGSTVNLTLRSGDVIHSFWIPRLAGKVDAVPGQDNYLKIQATEDGVYYGQCAEYCGEQHANMRMRVVALPPAEFAEWMERSSADAVVPNETENADAYAGYELFVSRGCAGCHTVNGYTTGNVGPNLTHVFDRSVFAGGIFQLDEQNLRRWLHNPQEEKPGSYMVIPQPLSETEITQLIAYLETLRSSDIPTAQLVSNETVPE